MTETIPTISVIVPCYNSGDAIKETIDSILANRCDAFDLEVIAVDDGSSDGTAGILREYGSLVRVIEKKNEGPCRARNDGIRAAAGNFIALCDHDDVWEPDKLALQLKKFEDQRVGLVCSDADSFNRDGVLIASMAAQRPLKRGKVFAHLLYSNFIIQSSVLVRRVVLDEVGYFAENIFPAEDLDLWLRISQRWQVDYVDRVLVHYRVSATMYSRNHIRMRVARIPVITEHAGKLDDQKHREVIIGKALSELAMDYWYARMFCDARKKMKEAISYRRNFRCYLYLFLTYLPESFLNTLLLFKLRVVQGVRAQLSN